MYFSLKNKFSPKNTNVSILLSKKLLIPVFFSQKRLISLIFSKKRLISLIYPIFSFYPKKMNLYFSPKKD